MSYLYAFLVAVALTAALIGIPNAIGALVQRSRFAEFALLTCPNCDTQFGLPAIIAGKDTSPWEELWSDGDDQTIHCRPTCRLVACPNCPTNLEIRFQTQGEFFGPDSLFAILKRVVTNSTWSAAANYLGFVFREVRAWSQIPAPVQHAFHAKGPAIHLRCGAGLSSTIQSKRF